MASLYRYNFTSYYQEIYIFQILSGAIIGSNTGIFQYAGGTQYASPVVEIDFRKIHLKSGNSIITQSRLEKLTVYNFMVADICQISSFYISHT